ncbi:MAG: hypothetical protein Q4A45_02585 [Clostridia bacterium]|nr:hypothetical protein [Clostridia bacterium]
MKKLFNFNKIPACEYCSFGRFSPDDAMILCIKKGIMMPGSSCSSFKYDVFKRRPKGEAKIFNDYSEDDFSL